MIQYAKFLKPICVAILFSLCFVSIGYSSVHENSLEFADRFAHESIVIASGQSVGTLMVAGGDATIGGKVTDGALVVDGNVRILSEAVVTGRIIVLGGSIIIEPGAYIAAEPWVIVPLGHPLIPVIVLTLFILGAASLVILPAVFWFIGHSFKKTRWYAPVREQFQLIEQRWPMLYIMASFGISAIMLAAFTTVAWETLFRHTMNLFDDSFIWLIRYYANPVVDKMMIGISDIGFGMSYIAIVGITLLYLVYLKRWRELGALAVCLTGGALLSSLLKILFHRARPDAFRVVQETGFSFPSGHALATMCFYGMVAFLMMRKMISWRGRLIVIVLTVFLSIAIGISRIYLGVHYPTDVMAGYAAGSMWLVFCISLLMWWEKPRLK